MFSRKPSPELAAIRAHQDDIKVSEIERKEALRRLLEKLEPTPNDFGWPLRKENGDD